MAQKEKEYGEGNYKASRKYNDATRQFVESGRVDEAARDAEPKDPHEAAELERAEAEGRRRRKEEDPAVSGPMPDDDPQGVRITDRPADETSTPEPGRD